MAFTAALPFQDRIIWKPEDITITVVPLQRTQRNKKKKPKRLQQRALTSNAQQVWLGVGSRGHGPHVLCSFMIEFWWGYKRWCTAGAEMSGNNQSLGMWTQSSGPTLILRAPLRVQNRQQREGESVNNQYKVKGMLCFFIVYLSP